ncbi:MAG: hypothetical protein NVSMB43_15780 [Pseudarthrobacter sp.]
MGPHGRDLQALEVFASHPDGAGSRVDHAKDEAGQGGLARPGWTEDGKVLPGGNSEIDFVQYGCSFAVSGRDVLKSDVRVPAL